jgi:hypothetical protein
LFVMAVPSAALFCLNEYIAFGGPQGYFAGALTSGVSSAFAHGKTAGLRYLLQEGRVAYTDYFFGGNTMMSYWGNFGWLDTPVSFGGQTTSAIVSKIIVIGTNLVILLTCVLCVRNLVRLARIGRRRSWQWALKLAVRNPVVSTYVIFTVFMLILYTASANAFGAQGRNWYPLEGSAFATMIVFVPRLAPSRKMRRAAMAIGSMCLIAYCTIGSYFCIRAVEDRYYLSSTPSQAWPVASYRHASKFPTPYHVDESQAGTDNALDPQKMANVSPFTDIHIRGWALDQRRGSNGGVYVTLDDKFLAWAQPYARPDVASAFQDPAFLSSGFDLHVKAPAQQGRHSIQLMIVSREGAFVYETPTTYKIDVQPNKT